MGVSSDMRDKAIATLRDVRISLTFEQGRIRAIDRSSGVNPLAAGFIIERIQEAIDGIEGTLILLERKAAVGDE